MTNKTFYYRKLTLSSKIGLSIVVATFNFLLITFIVYIQNLDLTVSDIIYLGLLFGFITTVMIFLSRTKKQEYDFACEITPQGINLPTRHRIPWKNIIDLRYDIESQIVHQDKGKVIIHHHFMDFYVKDYGFVKLHRVSHDTIKYYQPKEVFDEVNHHWQKLLNPDLSYNQISLPYTVHYNATPSNKEKLALRITQQGLQNQELLRSKRIVFWRNIQSIEIKRAFIGGYIAINLNNEKQYLSYLSLLKKLEALYYKKMGISYFYIHGDLKETSLFELYNILTNEWKIQTNQHKDCDE